ncbi:MAG: signal peptidase I [Nanoarchaeota archaeon]
MDIQKKEKSLKKFWKKFWFLLWKDDSIKGWIFSVIFLFLFIKLIFFPVLNLVTGTSLPLAIVESCSMYHKGDMASDFNSWWTRHEGKYAQYIINDLDFKAFSFKNGFNKGDILLITGTKPEKLKAGDIIVFEAGQRNPIIHRIINISIEDNKYFFSTMGDNNNGQLSIEKRISSDQIIGKAGFRLAPLLGWVKLIFYDGRNPESERGLCNEN